MLSFKFADSVSTDAQIRAAYSGLNLVESNSTEEKTRLLILRDLLRLNWRLSITGNEVSLTPPTQYDKDTIRRSMSHRRDEILHRNHAFINKMDPIARKNIASGSQVLEAKIQPIIEPCLTQEQNNLFRYFRYSWSSPSSDYVGRRIRLLIRDQSISGNPIIGIAALGSSIIHIPERDKWIGWSKAERTNNIIYAMDAYVIGAVPPYNMLLGGKLISYILASSEVRKIFEKKYRNKVTIYNKRKANRLACIFTTSLFGKSSQYNRLKFNGELLYKPIGFTKGYGTLHLSNETFQAMKQLIVEKGNEVGNQFGDGPSWSMRVIRTAGDILGFDSDFLLQHSFQREIYAIPLASNYKEFLRGAHSRLNYYNYSLEELTAFWRNRWFEMRKANPEVQSNVASFTPELFTIS